MKPVEFLEAERERVPKRTTMTVACADLLRWLGGLPSIPEEVVSGARALLEEAKQERHIRDFRLHPFGCDLLVQLTTLGQGLHDARPHRLIIHAFSAALARARRVGAYAPVDGRDFFDLSPREQIMALRLRPVEFPFTERAAEPLFIAKMMGGAVGAFNRMLFNLFFHPDKGSHQRLDGTRFVAVVENVRDLRAGKTDRCVYAFGDRAEEETLCFVYPFLGDPLAVGRDYVGDWGELLSLIADPTEWVVAAVYAVRGRFASDKGNLLPSRHEPVAVVSIEPALPGIDVGDPVAVLRLQSGLPTVGEAHFNLGADFHFVVGGPSGGYHVGLMPVTLEEARSGAYEPGTAKVAAYTYQSYDDGRVPPEHDVVDVFAQDHIQTEWLQDEARTSIALMEAHGEFQPYVTAEEAERRANAQAEQLKDRFRPVPAGDGEGDPLIAGMNDRSRGETLSDIKADGGGKVGHTTPPTLFAAVARASLQEAREAGLVRGFEVFGVGDDLHLVMRHSRGIDANDIHLLAFRTFWRMVWVTELIGYKPYSLAQDLQIGPATKGKKVDDLAEPSEGFLVMLDQTLPEPERSFLPQIRLAERQWKRGRASVEVKKPFAGNVTGQGPGFAELPFRGAGRIGLLAADKTGPAVFNIPVFHSACRVLQKGGLQRRPAGGIAFEIWDVHRHTRIFLDGRSQVDEVRTLLGATNLFNVKRLWSLVRTVGPAEPVESALGDILLAASTERLALIAGGEYVGKDDPVLLGVEELMEPIFEHIKTRFSMTQGDERGSHYMMPVPKPLPEAVATVRSRGLSTGLFLTLTEAGIADLQDVFAGPSYRESRIRIDKANARLWRAQGSEFTPVGVGARDVEPAYPLMKVLNRLTSEGSPYGQAVKSATGALYESLGT